MINDIQMYLPKLTLTFIEINTFLSQFTCYILPPLVLTLTSRKKRIAMGALI